jgi:hypothetical protein
MCPPFRRSSGFSFGGVDSPVSHRSVKQNPVDRGPLVHAICCSTARNWTRRALPPGTRRRVDAIRSVAWQPWSIGDAASIAKFSLRPGIGALTILVNNDESGIGQGQATEGSDWWTRARREILRLIPRSSNDDLNDLVRKWVVA